MGERLYPNIKRITNLFCLAIILLTVGLFALRLTALRGMVRDEAPPPAPTHEELMVNGMAFGYILLNDIDFDSPDAEGNIKARNIEENTLHMRLEIVYDITGRSVYLSPFLRPGEEIVSIRLQGSPLASGEHKCTAIITVYDPATRRQLHSHRQPVTIRIARE